MRYLVAAADVLCGVALGWVAWESRWGLVQGGVDVWAVFVINAAGSLLFIVAGVGLALGRVIAGRAGEWASASGILLGMSVIVSVTVHSGDPEASMVSGFVVLFALVIIGLAAVMWLANRSVGNRLPAPRRS